MAGKIGYQQIWYDRTLKVRLDAQQVRLGTHGKGDWIISRYSMTGRSWQVTLDTQTGCSAGKTGHSWQVRLNSQQVRLDTHGR